MRRPSRPNASGCRSAPMTTVLGGLAATTPSGTLLAGTLLAGTLLAACQRPADTGGVSHHAISGEAARPAMAWVELAHRDNAREHLRTLLERADVTDDPFEYSALVYAADRAVAPRIASEEYADGCDARPALDRLLARENHPEVQRVLLHIAGNLDCQARH